MPVAMINETICMAGKRVANFEEATSVVAIDRPKVGTFWIMTWPIEGPGLRVLALIRGQLVQVDMVTRKHPVMRNVLLRSGKLRIFKVDGFDGIIVWSTEDPGSPSKPHSHEMKAAAHVSWIKLN